MERELSTQEKREKICLAGVELLGREFLTEAFQLCHPKAKTQSESSLVVMKSRWYASERCKSFRQEIRERILGISATTGNDLTTRSGIVQQLISATKQTQGKDSISGLQTLAKIQGLDKPEDGESKGEKRTYFLPWVSSCRNCKLMEIFMKMQNEK